MSERNSKRIWKVTVAITGYAENWSDCYVEASSVSDAEKKALKKESKPGLDIEVTAVVLQHFSITR